MPIPHTLWSEAAIQQAVCISNKATVNPYDEFRERHKFYMEYLKSIDIGDTDKATRIENNNLGKIKYNTLKLLCLSTPNLIRCLRAKSHAEL